MWNLKKERRQIHSAEFQITYRYSILKEMARNPALLKSLPKSLPSTEDSMETRGRSKTDNRRQMININI